MNTVPGALTEQKTINNCMSKKKKKYNYNIDLVCEDCGEVFYRNKHTVENSKQRMGGIYCRKCTHKINNRRNAKKQAETHRKKMQQMTSEERKQKYGHDYWKKMPSFIREQKSTDGHGDIIKKVISQMSESERKEKYGRIGKLNPMFGRPPSKNSGIGYSGWYKGTFFRSKLELSFLLMNDDRDIISAESFFSIPYHDENGVQRTYRPDFIVDKKYVVEIKPYSMLKRHTLKESVAIEYFKNTDYVYEIVTDKDISTISFDELYQLYEKGNVTLTKSSKRRLDRKYEGKES